MSFVKKIIINKSIKNLDFQDYIKDPATLLINVLDINRESFETFATKTGEYLPYENRPSFAFTGEALDEVAPHFDGVSADKSSKVPEWLLFWAASEIEIGVGGNYKVCDGTIINKYPELKYELNGVRQQFINYSKSVNDKDAPEEFSFPIVQNYYDKLCLRLFFDPTDSASRTIPGVQTKLLGQDGSDMEKLRKPLHELFKDGNYCDSIRLEKNNILIINNFQCLHGRERLNKKSKRLFYRVQKLPISTILTS